MTRKLLLPILFLSQSIVGICQPTTWTPAGVGGGGALFSPSINPANPSEYYIACDMSQLFHTTDYGLSYSQVDFRQLQAGHDSKVCFTSNANIRYTITYANDMAIPTKSIDGGAIWTPLSGNPDNSETTYSIYVDYNTPNRVVIAYYGGIYISQNGGTSFTLAHTAANSGAGVVVGGVFFDGNTIYLGTSDGLLVSTNGGSSFSASTVTGIPTGQSIWSFAGAKSGNVTRLFCLTGNTADIYPGLQGSDYYGFMKGVYSLDYGTGNWTSKVTGITVGTDFPMFVAMAENDINTAYLAGSNSNSTPTVFKTVNGGGMWNQVFKTSNNQNIATGWSGQGGDRGWSYGECPFGVAVARNDPNYVVFGDFGFAHKTSNGGTSWQQAYVNTATQNPANAATPTFKSYESIGLENTTCWQVLWSDANTMFAGFSDIKGIRSTDAGASWSFNYTGLSANSTYRIAQHPTNGTLYAATSNIHDMYQSTRLADAQLDAADAQGNILYSTDKGTTWKNLHSFGHPVFWIALDPNNPNRAYASVIHYNGGSGVGGVYRCDNLQNLATSTWTLLPNPPRTEKHPASIVVLNDGNMVCTYSGRRTSTAFTASSGCFIYNPTGNAWTDVSHTGMYYWTKDIVLDPTDANQNTWYVCVFSGWGGAPNGLGGLYKTTNRGVSWAKLTGTQFDRVTSITFDPQNRLQAYLTTEQQGLWMSKNMNTTTPTWTSVSNYPFRQPERVYFNPYKKTEVWVTSFGNGMKMGTTTTTGFVDENLENRNANEELKVYPTLFSDNLHVLMKQGIEKMEVFNINGQLMYTTKITEQETILNTTNWPSGMYVIRAGTHTNKVVKE